MTRPPAPVWAMVAGGGTGGHVLPAIAVGRALVAGGRPREAIHFVGSKRGVEGRLVPEAGFSLTLLPGRGIARKLTLANVGAALGLVAAFGQALWLVARRRPNVVVSVGGYASVPCALAAVLLRVPLVLVGLDAVPGAALRLVARFAAASAVAFDGTPLPRAVTTGNPVRPEIASADRSPAGRSAARAELGLPDGRSVVGVFGGSLGARRINQAAIGLAELWSDRDDIAVHHAIGRRDWPELSARLPDTKGLAYHPVEYEDRMPLLMAAADVMVSRSGATTVAELAAVGVAAILVPLPGAPGDHQTANAAALDRAGAATLVPDGELSAQRLATELEKILGTPGRADAMAAAAKSLGRPNAAEAVAELVERHARH